MNINKKSKFMRSYFVLLKYASYSIYSYIVNSGSTVEVKQEKKIRYFEYFGLWHTL